MNAFPPSPGLARVVVIRPDPAAAEWASALLSPAEREQAERFHFEKDARHWSACRAALRTLLGRTLKLDPAAIEFEFEEFGKPRLPAPFAALHFNLSHCHDLALVALCSDGPVGIDLEPADRASVLLGCEDGFCHPDEIARLPAAENDRAAALLDLWTSKEALLKALGTGMSLAPQSVCLATADDPFPTADPRLQAFALRRLSHPLLQDHLARLACPRSVHTVRIDAFDPGPQAA